MLLTSILIGCALTTTALPPRTPASGVPWLAREDYPFTSRFMEVDGGAVHYVDEGAGSPVVLVHGTPSWSWEWRRSIAALRGDHRVLAPDHIGFGLSDKPADWDYTPAAHARNLATLLDAQDLHDATVVVHDFGGPIGLSWVLDHPDRVSRVVIVNTWMWSLSDDPRAARLSKLVAGPVGRYLYLDRNASPRKLIPWSVGKGFETDDAFLRPYTDVLPDPEHRLGPWRLGVELAGSSDWYASLWERRDTLRHLDVTLVWGMDDPTFGPATLDRWAEALPGAKVVRLDGVGHFPQEEAAERFVAVVRAAAGRPVATE
jgi:haloalkane dehalogenase